MRTLPVLALTLCLAGCDFEDFHDSRRLTEDFHQSYALKPGGSVTVENFNGSVEITGWEKDQVEINGAKYAPTQSLLAEMKVEIVASPDSVRVRVVKPDNRRGNMGARMTIHVPRKVELDRIQSSNGSLKASYIEGPVRMRTSNGSIEVRDLKGDGSLQTSNGRVTAERVRGGLDIATSNGSISAELLELRTSGGMRFHSSNGSITLRLPASVNARLSASTSNSSVSTDFDITRNGGEVSKRRISGTLGSGGPSIDVSTSNGSIKILKL
jgi:DUF4097 and DUF4098 domain-containing protein YvlB